MAGMALFLLILLGVVAIIGFWFVTGYNSLVRLKALLSEAWSGIEVQLKRRYDLIPNLVATVRGYSIHEKSVLENVTQMRAASVGATSISDKAAAEAGLTQSLKTLFAVAENYPDLKANENFLSLQKDLGLIEQDVQLARRYYNGTVRNYNVKVQMFPSRIIAAFAGFPAAPYFEVGSESERQAPKVSFE